MGLDLSSFKKVKPEFKLLSLIIIFLPIIVSLGVIVGVINIVSKSSSVAVINVALERNTPTRIYIKKIPISGKLPIYSYQIDADVSLDDFGGFVRAILVDENNDEYLVYEVYPLISELRRFSIRNTCEETCLLEGIIPSYLRIEGEKASLTLKNTFSAKTLMQSGYKGTNIKSQRELLKQKSDTLKLQNINNQILKNNLKWKAGETSISKMTYNQKRKLFPRPEGENREYLPNLQGFEFYKGGIFEIKTDEDSPLSKQKSVSQLPDSWDWRNVHGENWMTSVKDQGYCGSCWAFAAMGAIEADTNLYFNQHVNFDLSEQELISCSKAGSCQGGVGKQALEYIVKNGGIVDEACFPYSASDVACNQCSGNENRKIKIEESEYFYSLDEEEIKRLIKEKGVIYSRISYWGHAMALIGYHDRSDWKMVEHCSYDQLCGSSGKCVPMKCTDAGAEMTVCGHTYNNQNEISGIEYTFKCKNYEGYGNYWANDGQKIEVCGNYIGQKICIDNQCRDKTDLVSGSRVCATVSGFTGFFRESYQYLPGEGEQYWIFKNSWGENWGEQGYAKIAFSLQELGGFVIPVSPYTLPVDRLVWPTGFDGRIKCVDKDNDFYCNWGISKDKPSTCPDFCRSEKDGNDADPNLGPVETPTPSLNPTPVPYWKDCSYCDTNKDSKVCVDDIENIEAYFGKERTESDWSNSCPLCAKPESSTCDDCDFNKDGIINIFDIVRCSGVCYNCGI